jgi:DNA-binding response OmpR family regulator
MDEGHGSLGLGDADHCTKGLFALSIIKPDPKIDSASLKGVSVLVVEDAWHVAKAMKILLEQRGMEVMGPAATAMEARHLLATEKPLVALVDVNLKGEMAWDLIDELREDDIKVVVISGYPEPRASQGAPITYLQKPYNAAELITALHAIMEARS